MDAPFVHTLLAGQVKKLGDPKAKKRMEGEWETGMFKQATDKKVWLTKTGMTVDDVADKKAHGGPEKALFLYPTSHYDYWREELSLPNIGVGSMGENLAVHHMDESLACIGDIYQLGDAIIQVSQPRRPCWKPARRHRIMDFALRIQNSGRTGWYFRVLEEGEIWGNTALHLQERPNPDWTVKQCNEVMYIHKKDLNLAQELVDCTELAPNWKRTLHKRLGGKESSIEKRVYGPNKA